MPHSPKTDAEWEAESDARTLSEAEIIGNDQPRMASAKIAADRLAKEERERAAALEKVGTAKNEAVTRLREKQFPNTQF